MYRKELDFKLNGKDFPRVFMLYGAEDYQVEHYAKEILAKFEGDLVKLSFDEYDFSKAKEHLEGDSLFGDMSILHIKTDKKLQLKELKSLISLALKGANSVFIYELHDDDKSLKDQTAAFGKSGNSDNFARFFAPNNQREVIEILKKHTKKLNLKVADDTVLVKIYNIHNQNIYLAAAELNRIASMYEMVNDELVNKLVSSLSGISFDNFFVTILMGKNELGKNIKEAIMDFLKNSGLDEIKIVNALYKSFYRLFTLYSAWKINPSTNIKDILGYAPPAHVTSTLKAQANIFSTPMFLEIFIHLNTADFELKKAGNQSDKELFFIASLLELRNIIAKHSKN